MRVSIRPRFSILGLVAVATLCGCAPRQAATERARPVVASDAAEALYGDWQVASRVGEADLRFLPPGCKLGDVVFRRDHTFTIYEYDVAVSGYFVAIRESDDLDVTLQPTSYADGTTCLGNPASGSRPLMNRRSMRYRVEDGTLLRRHSQSWASYTRLAPRWEPLPSSPQAARQRGTALPEAARPAGLRPEERRRDTESQEDCAFRLVDPTTVTVDGVAFAKPGPGRFDDSTLAFLHVMLIGYGRFVVSAEPFAGAEPVGQFEGSHLSVVVSGKTLDIRASDTMFSCSRPVDAYVRFDPLPESARLPIGDVGLSIGMSGTVNVFGPAYQLRKATERRAALAARESARDDPH